MIFILFEIGSKIVKNQKFGQINEKEWNVPKFINQTRLNESLEKIKFSLRDLFNRGEISKRL